MDRNFYDNDFEEFLKQKADQYKMYPSDRVWNNIYSTLHGRRKWVILGFTLLFLTSALFIGKQVLLSNYSKVATQLNEDPEKLLPPKATSNKVIARGAHQYILRKHIRPTAGNTTLYPDATSTAQPPAENNTDHTITVSKIYNKVAVTTAEGEPLVIESNLLPAVLPSTPETQVTHNLNSGLPPAVEKQTNLAPVTKKINQLKEENAGATIQNAIAAINPAKPSKWFLQLYASPIISYRRLSNETQPDSGIPASASYAGNINKYVNHKPAPGFEVGGKIQYKLSNSLSVYAGAQLNYSRYYIDAYKYRTEKASIALNGSRSSDTLSGYTDIRNFSGYAPEQLQNQYWQLSVPVGIEIKLLGQKKLQLNVAGGFQPTFLVSSNSYLISSDYKNYIQSPDLARSFNVHTNFEAFVSYQAAGFKWQLGPQFRSQLLSSYSNQYRVREYLTEFGIKFGITKTLR
jgi:Outer membrane protein beta-barrel domain